MVLPGDELTVKLCHVGMREGNIVVSIETSNNRGEKVMQGSAEVAQPTTTYVFTGQGSQEQGMGMDLYNNSPSRLWVLNHRNRQGQPERQNGTLWWDQGTGYSATLYGHDL